MEKDFHLLRHQVSIRPEDSGDRKETAAQAMVERSRILAAGERLRQYKAGKQALERRIIENENWYRLRHWEQVPGGKQNPSPGAELPAGVQSRENSLSKQSRPASAWLFNSLANKHADAMDNYPEPAVLPREEGDAAEAKSLSAILPVVIERNGYEQTYSKAWWDKLKHGTAAYGAFWDSSAENGLGDIALRQIDLLNLYWQPGVEDIQDSPHLYILGLVDNALLEAQYPQLRGKLGGQSIDMPDYRHDDSIDQSGKSVVVDWYYKVKQGSRTLLHYCKFCGDTVLFSSEGNPDYSEGWYSHGQYPVVLDVLFPIKGSPAGFGYVDVMRDPQLYIDSLDELILRNARLAGTPRYFVRENAGLSREQFADWREPFVDVAVSLDESNLKQIDVKPLDGYIVNHLQHKINELKETSGNRDFNQGGTGGGVTAAAAISALQEAGNKLSRDMIKGSYRAFVKLNQLVIELIRQFYDEERSFRIEGQAGVEYLSYSNQNIRPQQRQLPGGGQMLRKAIFDIKVKAQRSNPFSQMSQNETAKELYGLGFFNPQMAEQSLTALELMEFEGKAKVLERIQEGQSLLNIVSQQQEQLAKMSAVINQMAGRAILPVDSGPGGNPAAPKPAPGGAAMENENDAARRNSTAYADRLAKRSAVDLGGGK